MHSHDDVREQLIRLASWCHYEHLIDRSEWMETLAKIQNADQDDQLDGVFSPSLVELMQRRLARLGEDFRALKSRAMPDTPTVTSFESDRLMSEQPSTALDFEDPLEVDEHRYSHPANMASDLKVNHLGRLLVPCAVLSLVGLVSWVVVSAMPMVEAMWQENNRRSVENESASPWAMSSSETSQPSGTSEAGKGSENEEANNSEVVSNSDVSVGDAENQVDSLSSEEAAANPKLVALTEIEDDLVALEPEPVLPNSIDSFCNSKQWKDALAVIDELGPLSPRLKKQANLYRAAILIALGDGEKISQSLELLVSPECLDPSNQTWRLTFAASLIKASKAARANAIEILRAAVSENPSSPDHELVLDWVLARCGFRLTDLTELPARAADFKASAIDHLFIVFSNFNSANTIQKQFNLDKAELAIDQLENGFQYQDEPAWLRNVYLAELHNAISTLKSSLNAGK
ncbi:MAG: hypothetical protein KDB22_01870 [Planctomycetales bacterium]|nr:hypothetical protein [Planctomycetales bacterium]